MELLQDPPISSDDLRLFTDASDLGYGCVFENRWIFGQWQAPWRDLDINVRELFAVWVAIHTWGDNWANKQIIMFTDSSVAKDIWKKGTCKDKQSMKVVRAMFMFAAKRNLNILLQHVPGKNNILADHLSRLQVQQFRQKHPSAEPSPTTVSQAVWDV